jgi:pimeloyl-ACP methyl ester carboxylesterase
MARPAIHPEYPTYFAPTNGISIAYQEFGNPANETILLVMGLGGQLIHWNDDFVQRLVAQGYHVIRFDNRDIGLSEKFYDESVPGLFTMIRYKLGMDLGAPYSLSDMAADGIGLLDYLDIEQAHVVGVSMGGMIAQLMAAEYPQRILSLASIMSTSGAADLPEGQYKVEMRDRDGMTREQIIELTAQALKGIYAKEGTRTEQDWLDEAARGFDRSHYDPGFARQIWAILGSGDRVELLKSLRVPTLVIHGSLDPLLPIEHGKNTAELVPQASWLELDDMGHYLAQEHNARVVSALMENFARVAK